MYFIFENNNFRTNARGNRVQIKNTTKMYDKLSHQGYTELTDCFETEEIDKKFYKLTLDGKDLLTAKKGRLRTTKETNKNYAKLSEKYTLVRIPNTHVIVKNIITQEFFSNRKGRRTFKIGSSTLTRLLQKKMLLAPVGLQEPFVVPEVVANEVAPVEIIEHVDAPIAEHPFNPDNQDEKKGEVTTSTSFEQADNKIEHIDAPIAETSEVAISAVLEAKLEPTLLADESATKTDESEYETDEEEDRPSNFDDVEIHTDRDKLKQIVQSCYVAHMDGRDLITFKMRCEDQIKFYSMQIYPLLEDGKWNMVKAIKQLSYFMKYPQYYKNTWSSRDAEKYADKKNIGASEFEHSASEAFTNAEIMEAMEIDLARMGPPDDFNQAFLDAMLTINAGDDDDLGLGNLFGDNEGDNRFPYEIAGFDNVGDYIDSFHDDRFPYEIAGFDNIGDYIDSFGCHDEINYKPDLKTRTMNVMKQINVEKVHNNCFREALDHHGLDSKTTGLVSINDILNELEDLKVNYIIYNPILNVLENEYIKSHLGTRRVLLGQSTKANTPKILHREIKVEPIIEYQCSNYEGPVYIFALFQSTNFGHIYVPQTIELFTNASQKSIFQIVTHREIRYMKKITSVSNKQKSNYIYYDIETNETTDSRKFKCNSVSILRHSCAHDMYKMNETKIVEMLKQPFVADGISQQKSICYLQRGTNDTKEDIERRQSPNLRIVDEINLWSIILREMDPDAQNYIVSFNGACFDNLFLLKSIIDNKILCDTSICGGLIELSTAHASDMPAFRTLDIRRLLGGVGSLENHSRSFIKDITMRKVCNKKLFRVINDKYRNGKILDDDAFIDEFIGYNNLDVESLMLIHCAMLRALTQITNDEQIETILSRCVSLAQFSMIWFKKGIKSMPQSKKPQKFANVGKVPGLTEEDQKLQYDLLKTYKTGGRCQARKTEVLESKFDQCSLDVASLYPFVMMCYNKGFYMAGKLIPTNVYVEGKPGIYFGTVTQINNGNNEMGFFCNKSIIANDWDVFGRPITRVVMTSHDIEEILKKKPHWQFTIVWGYYTEHSARGIDIFSSILPFMKEKAVQDALAVNKDPNANTAIREMCKSVMNSLSGKFLQAVKQVEKYVIEPDVLDLLRQNGTVINSTIDTVRKDDDDYHIESLKKDKMLHVGLFIYSLSKIYMYQNAYSVMNDQGVTVIGKNEFAYTDTDSNKIVKQEVFDNWMQLRGARSMVDQVWPEVLNMNLGYTPNTTFFYNGEPGTIKCMGQFEDEYKGKRYNNAIYLNKKEYMVWKTVDGKITTSCIKLKGVQCTKLKILNKENIEVGRDISENKLFTINYIIGRNECMGIEEGYMMGANINGRWECLINNNIYGADDYWWNENNRLTDEIESIELEKQTDHDAYVRKFIYIMKRKWRGMKTLVLIKNFHRNLDLQEVRNTFMIKRI